MAGAFDAGTVSARLILDINEWSTNLEKAKADTTALANVVESKKAAIQDMGKAFTAAGAAITLALGSALKKAADYGDQLAKTSQRTGIAVETLSGLKLAAELSDMSMEGLAGSLAKMSRTMNDAQLGVKESKEAYQRLGVTVTDSSGKLKPMDAMLGEIADKFQTMPDGVEKSAMAMEIFGRSGVAMIPLLNQGSAGLRLQREEAERLGVVMGDKLAKASEAFNDQITVLKTAFLGIAVAIGQTLMPVVKGIVDIFTSAAVAVRKVHEIFPPLGNAITLIVGAFGALMAVLGPMLLILPRLMDSWTKISALLPIIGTKIAAVSSAMTLSLPIYAAVAAAVYVVVSAIKAYSASCDEAIADIYKTAKENKRNWDFIKDTIHGSNEKIKDSIKAARVRLTEMGYTSEEVGAIIYKQFQHMAKGAQQVREDTKEMADALLDVQANLTDKIKSLTLNEYDYRIYQAKRYYDDLKLKVKDSVNYESVAAEADRALAIETAKIKKEQAEASAAAHESAAGKAFDVWKDCYDAIKKMAVASEKVIEKELAKIPKAVSKVTVDTSSRWGTFNTNFRSSFKKTIDSINEGIAKFSEKFGGAITASLQAFSMVTSAMSQMSQAKYQQEVAILDMEYEKKRQAIENSLMNEEEKNAALVKLEEEYTAKKKEAERKQAEANKKSSIMQAIVNTALAVTAALSTKPFIPMGLFAAAAALAAGLIQISTIKAQAVPEMAEGGLVRSPTHVLAGEAGPEAILPMRELKRMLGVDRKSGVGSKTVNVNIQAIDTNGMKRFVSSAVIPAIKNAFKREELTVSPNAVR